MILLDKLGQRNVANELLGKKIINAGMMYQPEQQQQIQSAQVVQPAVQNVQQLPQLPPPVVAQPTPVADAPTQPVSPLPTITQNLNQAPKPLTTTPVSQRMASLPARGEVGSMPQWKGINKRFVADLPAKVQIQGIQAILSGQDIKSPIINNFVRGLASQGKSIEEIRQLFIKNQKISKNPLVLM